MAIHRYSIGETVCFRSTMGMARTTPDSFEIVALMPRREGVFQYRIRSENERCERVAGEDDIETVRPLHDRVAVNSNVPDAGRPS